MVQSLDSVRAEEARIRAAYAKREGDTRYSWFSPGYLFDVQQRERRFLALLNSMVMASPQHWSRKQFLRWAVGQGTQDTGCVTSSGCVKIRQGRAAPENVTGIDLLPDRVTRARRLCPSDVRIQCASAAELPFSDERFDLVLQATVFTSILDPDLKRRVATEMMRVVKPEGFILWYDYHVNNPWNSDVRAVKREEISQLFPDCRIELDRITLLPPLARLLAPYSYLGCYLLEKLPLLCTHYLGVIRKV